MTGWLEQDLPAKATSSLDSHVKVLLAALRGVGRDQVADDFEREFKRRGWQHLTPEDAQRILVALRPDGIDRRDQHQPARVVKGPMGPQDPEHPANPLQALTGFEPFLTAIKGGEQILEAIDALAKCVRWESFERAADRLITSVLGFEPHRVDLSERVGQQSTIQHLKIVGRYRGFDVAVVGLNPSFADTKWSATATHYQTCVPLVPRGLLISFEPGSGAIRFVYRHQVDKLRYRALVGPAGLRDADDNLLTWTRRLEQIRPQEQDDHVSLQQRVAERLGPHAAALAEAWPSAPIDLEPSPSGRTFDDQVARFGQSFLQDGVPPERRLTWGLNAALRSCFPAPIWSAHLRLLYEGYDIVERAQDPDACWRAGSTMSWVLRIRLSLATWDGSPIQDSAFDSADRSA